MKDYVKYFLFGAQFIVGEERVAKFFLIQFQLPPTSIGGGWRGEKIV